MTAEMEEGGIYTDTDDDRALDRAYLRHRGKNLETESP